jgi:hypothetical protein
VCSHGRRCTILSPLCPSYARQSRTPLSHNPGQRIRDAPQHSRPEFHVVVRCQHGCVPSQPYLQPLGWSHMWRSHHSPYVGTARRLQIPHFRLHHFRQSARRNLSEKAFRGVLLGYPHDASGYRVYNSETRRITTSVHVVFQEETPDLGARLPVNSAITDTTYADDPQDTSPKSYPLTPFPLTPSRSPSSIPHLRPTAHFVSGVTPPRTRGTNVILPAGPCHGMM